MQQFITQDEAVVATLYRAHKVSCLQPRQSLNRIRVMFNQADQ